MKPEDLKTPFTWLERRILIQDRIWYVPFGCHEPFQFPGWHHPDLFGNYQPVNIEYCSGNGAWIAARAAEDPTRNWVAVEKKFLRARKIWSKIKKLNLNNLIVVCGEAQHVTMRFFPEESVNEVYINFPDPWPKRRHAKYRLMQPEFVKEQLRILKAEGSLDFVTDDSDYSTWTVKVMLQPNTGFISHHPDPHYITGDIGYGSSYFDRLWRDQGKEIRYHRFCKAM